ncbi:MAG: MBL fold metallo-hydrolase [Dehalococcoidia bacterium]|nr:MBL fold metallo-hydrolase [Dehalococcoidia bacterium]
MIPSGAKFRIGGVDLAVVNDGTYWYDAGAIFGVVPRVMWERVSGPLDDRYRIPLGLNCLLLRSQGKTILIETGVGAKPGDRDAASPAEEGTLLDSLGALGVTPEEVDIVVNTHLHADHCGWNTTIPNGGAPDAAPVPTFPNARYVVSAREWEDATHPNERTRATYLSRNLDPIADRLDLMDGEHRITDEVIFVPAPGHTDGHSTVVVRSGQEWGVYLGDLAQHRTQLERTPWVSGLDTLPLVSMETKKRLMDECIEAGALVMFCHGAYPGVGRMTRTPEGYRKWVDVEPLPPEAFAREHGGHEDGGHEHGGHLHPH